MGSVWSATAELPSFPKLENDLNVDVLIIGGGMAGILTAYRLKEAGVDYALCEAETTASGTTKNTTAKITSQHGFIYDKLIREFGVKKAGLFLRANEEAIEAYRALCGGIDCDFETQDNYIYSLDDAEIVDREMKALKKLGRTAKRFDVLDLPFDVAGAIRFSGQAQFHPLKFLAEISKGLRVFSHTRVRGLKRTKEGILAVTSGGTVFAKRVIVATHFPFLNKHGAFFLKQYQHRSYVIAIENGPKLGGMFLDDDPEGLSFRNYGDLLLIGGGSHRTGKKGGGYAELKDVAELYFNKVTVRYAWAAQDCMTLDAVPYIGRYSSGTEGLYVATGFNKWGMTGSMVAAGLLCDLITGKDNPYASVFRPSRTMLRASLFANVFSSITGLLTPTAPRCPHLGCALRWNEEERSWDCPCHGSRFAEDGSLIDNPATGDLKRARETQN
jgi:glycine/D-amino acid oxidase-like deaminating enzyme